MRILALDVGRRRIGLAISDRTRTLARPLTTIMVTADKGIDAVVQHIDALASEDDGLERIVVGLPTRLDGTPTEQTTYVTMFADQLKRRMSLPVVLVDERLTSHEAESRLALRERDWRERKKQLDAAAAAVILQDYLDRGAHDR